ncbi:hypothetical protein N658DRAFT_111594 [Parathielavia hyrcaniae]|uniref:Clr5 domain-containing protein n=1 Tax=Parathielavia hyrcaniae TaxID=113614 RepID=A0AAN6T574_9PEZI|nr:hypothetical protein N658DRAFT_111594 [Parathielavia hyrcaniae]
MTKQWDKYREIIVAEYKDRNKPLHEVRRSMAQKYNFQASIRAYRSRFDKWGVTKYSRRGLSSSLGRRESVSDSDGRASSPRQSPEDEEEGGSRAATPVAETLNELLIPESSLAAPRGGFRSSLCLVKTDFSYTPVTPSPSPAMEHGPAYQFGSGLAPFGSQNAGCYSSMSMPMYRHDPRDVVIVAPDTPRGGHRNVSLAGIQAGYGYTLGLLSEQA